MATEKQLHVIGDALARAMYNAALPVLETLRESDDNKQAVHAIAQSMVRELAHARWSMKGPPRTDKASLETLFFSALRVSNCPDMASLNPDVAKSARNEAVGRICKVLGSYKVVLVQWKRR